MCDIPPAAAWGPGPALGPKALVRHVSAPRDHPIAAAPRKQGFCDTTHVLSQMPAVMAGIRDHLHCTVLYAVQCKRVKPKTQQLNTEMCNST